MIIEVHIYKKEHYQKISRNPTYHYKNSKEEKRHKIQTEKLQNRLTK